MFRSRQKNQVGCLQVGGFTFLDRSPALNQLVTWWREKQTNWPNPHKKSISINFIEFNPANLLKKMYQKTKTHSNTEWLNSWMNYFITTQPRKLIFREIICFQRIPIKHWLCILRSTLHPLRQYQSPADRHTNTHTHGFHLYSFWFSPLIKSYWASLPAMTVVIKKTFHSTSELPFIRTTKLDNRAPKAHKKTSQICLLTD